MNEKDKELLLTDLSARLPYGVKIHTSFMGHGSDEELIVINKNAMLGDYESVVINPVEDDINDGYELENVKPYLRPISDMTPEEYAKYYDTQYHFINDYDDHSTYSYDTLATYDYLNSIHVDYRGLINKGLAIKVTKENNPYKQ